MLKRKEKAKEVEKKTPAELGWEQLKDNQMMLQLKTQRVHGALEHAASVFDEQHETLDIWMKIVSCDFIVDVLKQHRLDFPEDFVVMRGGIKTFFSISLREAILCYAARIWVQGVHPDHRHAEDQDCGHLFPALHAAHAYLFPEYPMRAKNATILSCLDVEGWD